MMEPVWPSAALAIGRSIEFEIRRCQLKPASRAEDLTRSGAEDNVPDPGVRGHMTPISLCLRPSSFFRSSTFEFRTLQRDRQQRREQRQPLPRLQLPPLLPRRP
jgi:hypothetical protein